MLNFFPASKDRLFYDKYEYGICISMNEASVLRAKTEKGLDSNISYRNHARQQYWGGQKGVIDSLVKADLLAVWKELDAVRDSIKLVVSYNVLYIYSNDVKVLQHLADLPHVHFNSATQAIVDRPRDVVFKTNPKFAYRSYFRERLLEDGDRARLLNFLDTRKDSFSITNTVKTQLSRRQYNWLQRHHFVEHNDPKDITMLSLVCPGLIRKTVSVQAK